MLKHNPKLKKLFRNGKGINTKAFKKESVRVIQSEITTKTIEEIDKFLRSKAWAKLQRK